MKRKEVVNLLIYVSIVALSSIALVDLFDRAWEPGLFVFDLFVQFLTPIFGSDANTTGLHVLGSLLLGVYGGVLLIFVHSARKTFQGLILIVGSVFVALGLKREGILLASIDFTYFGNILAGISGVGVGIIAAGWPLILSFEIGSGRGGNHIDISPRTQIDWRRTRLSTITVSGSTIPLPVAALYVEEEDVNDRFPNLMRAEFDNSGPLLLGISFAVITVALAQVVVAGRFRLLDMISSAFFCVALTGFVRDRIEEETFVVFAERAGGKTTFFYCTFQELLNREHRDSEPLEKSEDFKNLLDDIESRLDFSNVRADQDLPDWDVYERWPIQATDKGEADDISFKILVGELFPKVVEFKIFDISGELYADVARELGVEFSNDDLYEAQTTEERMEVRRVAEEIAEADTVFVLLNANEFISRYETKVEQLPNDKDKDNMSRSDLIEVYPELVRQVSGQIVPILTKGDLTIDSDFAQLAPLNEEVERHLIREEFGERLAPYLREDTYGRFISGEQAYDLLRINAARQFEYGEVNELIEASGGEIHADSTIESEKDEQFHMVYVPSQIRAKNYDEVEPDATGDYSPVRAEASSYGSLHLEEDHPEDLVMRQKAKVHYDKSGELALARVGFERVANLIEDQHIDWLGELKPVFNKFRRTEE